MKAYERIIALTLAVILCILSFPVIAIAADPAPVIMDFTSKEALNKNAVLYAHDGQTEGEGFKQTREQVRQVAKLAQNDLRREHTVDEEDIK